MDDEVKAEEVDAAGVESSEEGQADEEPAADEAIAG